MGKNKITTDLHYCNTSESKIQNLQTSKLLGKIYCKLS
jgi:hypothetical protein